MIKFLLRTTSDAVQSLPLSLHDRSEAACRHPRRFTIDLIVSNCASSAINYSTSVWRRKWFKDVYQATELVDVNAGVTGVGQMTSPNGLG